MSLKPVFPLMLTVAAALVLNACSAPAASTLAPTAPVQSTPPAAAPQSASQSAAPSLEKLKNLEYTSEFGDQGKAQLKDGKYQAASGSASKNTITLGETYATGDLNQDGTPDAAVILIGSGGGSGSFYSLAAVLNENGTLRHAASITLGDREKINSLSISAGQIQIDMITHGSKDPLCCPSAKATKIFRFEKDHLTLVSASIQEATETSSATTQPKAAAQAQGSYADPFAYCAAVKDMDVPDAQYTGAKFPEPVAKGLIQALEAGAELEKSEAFKTGSFWRCMDSKVVACFVGANLPCQTKMDADRTPKPELVEYCKSNPGSDFIPMAVTGHASAYAWRCKNGAPEIAKTIAKADARGYISNIWYEIKPVGTK